MTSDHSHAEETNRQVHVYPNPMLTSCMDLLTGKRIQCIKGGNSKLKRKEDLREVCSLRFHGQEL